MLADRSFPGRLHFIGHAIRDIADRLVFVIDGDLKARRVQYETHLDKLMGVWSYDLISPDGPDSDGGSEITDATISIPRIVYSQLNQLMQEHRSRRTAPDNFELLFRALIRDDPTTMEIARHLVDRFKKERRWFMDRAHLSHKPLNPVSEAELRQHFERFEKMLHGFVGHFFTTTSELDEILRDTNKTAD